MAAVAIGCVCPSFRNIDVMVYVRMGGSMSWILAVFWAKTTTSTFESEREARHRWRDWVIGAGDRGGTIGSGAGVATVVRLERFSGIVGGSVSI